MTNSIYRHSYYSQLAFRVTDGQFYFIDNTFVVSSGRSTRKWIRMIDTTCQLRPTYSINLQDELKPTLDTVTYQWQFADGSHIQLSDEEWPEVYTAHMLTLL